MVTLNVYKKKKIWGIKNRGLIESCCGVRLRCDFSVYMLHFGCGTCLLFSWIYHL